MIKIVLDTNVLVSALISPKGPPGRILDKLAESSIQPILSPAIIAEYEDVLSRKKFGLSPATADAIMRNLRKLAVEVVPSESFHVCSDPDDDIFIDCAIAAGALYLVSGNLKHFPKLFEKVRIVSPAAFLREVTGRITPPEA